MFHQGLVEGCGAIINRIDNNLHGLYHNYGNVSEIIIFFYAWIGNGFMTSMPMFFYINQLNTFT